MKKRNLFFLILILIVFSCGDDANNGLKEDIELSTKKVFMWNGQETSVEVKTALSKPFIRVEDASIAKAEFKDNVIYITTLKSGNTSVYISDPLHNESYVEVISGSIQGDWNEMVLAGIGFDYSVEVIADKIGAKAELETQILKEIKNKLGSVYVFGYDNTTLVAKIVEDQEKKVGKQYDGSYTYNENNSVLTLKYNGITEIYNVYPYNYYAVKLEQDLTDVYKSKYPDYGIKKILTGKYIIKPRNL